MESPTMITMRDMAIQAVPQILKGPIFDIAIRAISQPHPLPPMVPRGALDDGKNNDIDNHHPLIGPTYYLGNPHTTNSSPSTSSSSVGSDTIHGLVENDMNKMSIGSIGVAGGIENVSTSTVSDFDSTRRLDRMSVVHSDTSWSTTTNDRPNDTIHEKTFSLFSDTDDGGSSDDGGGDGDGGD